VRRLYSDQYWTEGSRLVASSHPSATANNPWPHWHILSFLGLDGYELRGAFDLTAVDKDHGKARAGTKRGDALQIILIQVKGGSAAAHAI
jgi:hypothetical protein